MTIREILNREFRSAKRLVLTGFLLFFGGVVAAILLEQLLGPKVAVTPILILAALAGWVTMATGMVSLWYKVKCPLCGGKLWFLQMTPGGSWWRLDIPAEYRFCPFCGSSFDAKQ